MKMIWAILISGSVVTVIEALKKAGISGMTCMDAASCDQEFPIPGGTGADTGGEREILMIVLPDNEIARAVITIRNAVKELVKSCPYDPVHNGIVHGKIFVTYVEGFYTIRTAPRNAMIPEHEKDHCNHPE